MMEWLGLWRSLAYRDILAHHKDHLDVIGQTMLDLAQAGFDAPGALSQPTGLMLGKMHAARLRDADAWLHLAEMLPEHLAGPYDYNALPEQMEIRSRKKTDLEGTCLLLACAYGSRWSKYMLAVHLAIEGHAELARKVLPVAEIEGVYTPFEVLRVNSGIPGVLPDLVPSSLAEIREMIRKIDSRSASPPKLAWERLLPDASAAEFPNADHTGPFAYVLPRKIPLPADRDFRRVVEDANRLLVKVPLREAKDPDAVAGSLAAEFPWMDRAIEMIRQNLVLAGRLGGTLTLPPTCFVGPPGCGKSRFARRLAETLDLPYVRMSCAGMSDNRILAGTAQGWSSQTPSLPVTLMMRHRIANAAIILDEVEKAGGSERNGRVDQTLLGMVEKETARNFFDEGLAADLDISRITWFFTANGRGRISPLLRSRLDFIEVGLPRPQDFDVILGGALWDIAREYDTLLEELPDLDPVVVGEMREGFRCGRLTARQLGKLVRAALVAAADADQRLPRH